MSSACRQLGFFPVQDEMGLPITPIRIGEAHAREDGTVRWCACLAGFQTVQLVEMAPGSLACLVRIVEVPTDDAISLMSMRTTVPDHLLQAASPVAAFIGRTASASNHIPEGLLRSNFPCPEGEEEDKSEVALDGYMAENSGRIQQAREVLQTCRAQNIRLAQFAQSSGALAVLFDAADEERCATLLDSYR